MVFFRRFGLVAIFSSISAIGGLSCTHSLTSKFFAPSGDEQSAEKVISGETMLESIRKLSSDEFEGRSPGSAGEELTVNYLIQEYKRLGLKPGNPDGTFVQKVPLVGATTEYKANFENHGHRSVLIANKDIVATSHQLVSGVEVKQSELIFVGYGVVAPEFGWDDYKDVDVRGKTLVMLVNDPQIPDPLNPNQLDERMFKGNAMTYYGRWTYKYEIAAKKGAAAAILIHETSAAGYPFEVVINSWGREVFDTESADLNQGRTKVEAWIANEKARTLFKECGQDFDTLKKAALSRNFRPIALGTKFNISLKRNQRKIFSRNVIGKIDGADSSPGHRYLVYSAHWDHFGRDPKLTGDQIFHGALDNASGVAALLETAKAFKALTAAPKSTILFIATTAEERGLLGAHYYAQHPLYPLSRTLADLNFDGVTVDGRTHEQSLVGKGSTTLEGQLAQILEASGRKLVPEDDPEKGMYYRTDQFEFSKAGVPSLTYISGIDFVGKPASFGIQRRDAYIAHDYHKVSDVIKPDWDLSGAVEDVQVFFRLGYQIAEEPRWPSWLPGAEFGAIRSASENDRK